MQVGAIMSPYASSNISISLFHLLREYDWTCIGCILGSLICVCRLARIDRMNSLLLLCFCL